MRGQIRVSLGLDGDVTTRLMKDENEGGRIQIIKYRRKGKDSNNQCQPRARNRWSDDEEGYEEGKLV